jgi:hypothetical protein
MHSPSHPPWLDHSNDAWWAVPPVTSSVMTWGVVRLQTEETTSRCGCQLWIGTHWTAEKALSSGLGVGRRDKYPNMLRDVTQGYRVECFGLTFCCFIQITAGTFSKTVIRKLLSVHSNMYLTIIASHFLSARLTYKPSTCNKQRVCCTWCVSVRDACLLLEGNKYH